MSRFNVFLHRTEGRLTLPPATKSMILVEIASDLEDLFQHYLRQGMSEEEAATRAEEKVDMSDEALVELVRIHADSRSWGERIVRRAQSFAERIAMALIVIFLVGGATLGTEMRVFADVNGAILPIAVILVVLVVSFLMQMMRFSKRGSARRLRDGLSTPLFLGAASLVVGFVGSGIQLYRALMRMGHDPENNASLFSHAVLGSTATLSIAMLVALGAGVAWFVLASRLAQLEDEVASSFREVSS